MTLSVASLPQHRLRKTSFVHNPITNQIFFKNNPLPCHASALECALKSEVYKYNHTPFIQTASYDDCSLIKISKCDLRRSTSLQSIKNLLPSSQQFYIPDFKKYIVTTSHDAQLMRTTFHLNQGRHRSRWIPRNPGFLNIVIV